MTAQSGRPPERHSRRLQIICFIRKPLRTLKAKLVGATAVISFVFTFTTDADLVILPQRKWQRYFAEKRLSTATGRRKESSSLRFIEMGPESVLQERYEYETRTSNAVGAFSFGFAHSCVGKHDHFRYWT